MWPAWAWTKIRFGAPGREGNALLSYFLAVLAASANATSSVLQRKGRPGAGCQKAGRGRLVMRRPADAYGAG